MPVNNLKDATIISGMRGLPIGDASKDIRFKNPILSSNSKFARAVQAAKDLKAIHGLDVFKELKEILGIDITNV